MDQKYPKKWDENKKLIIQKRHWQDKKVKYFSRNQRDPNRPAGLHPEHRRPRSSQASPPPYRSSASSALPARRPGRRQGSPLHGGNDASQRSCGAPRLTPCLACSSARRCCRSAASSSSAMAEGRSRSRGTARAPAQSDRRRRGGARSVIGTRGAGLRNAGCPGCLAPAALPRAAGTGRPSPTERPCGSWRGRALCWGTASRAGRWSAPFGSVVEILTSKKDIKILRREFWEQFLPTSFAPLVSDTRGLRKRPYFFPWGFNLNNYCFFQRCSQ